MAERVSILRAKLPKHLTSEERLEHVFHIYIHWRPI